MTDIQRRTFQWLKTTCALVGWMLAWPAMPAAAETAQAPFRHPGLLHTEDDFERMRTKVAAGTSPWIEGWQRLIDDPRSQLDYRPRPTERVVRGNVPGQNVRQFFTDVHAAYQLALRWKVSGDEAYARKSIEILNGWSSTLREVGGNADRFLAAGIHGYQFANAAEIMRTYPGWATEDFKRFQDMMVNIFYPMNRDFLTRHNGAAITNYWANWDLCNMASMLAIGVLCDRRDIYDEAVMYFKNGGGNGAMDKAVYYVHPGYLGQWQESGRDQGHNTLGIALMGPICEMAWNQGDDLYGYDNNRFLAGAEYVAKYNLGEDVPYQLYAWGTGQRGQHREQPGISPAGRGGLRPVWELVVNHYVNRMGIAAPHSEQAAMKTRPEGGAGGHASSFDQLGFGTLTFFRDVQVADPKPSGLTARKSGDAVVLSWWGAAGSTSYNVRRAPAAGGPYTTIASGIKDVFTFTDHDLKPGTYFYSVTGVRNGKETDPSNVVVVSTTPVLMTHLKFDETGSTKAINAVDKAEIGTLHNGAIRDSGRSGMAISLDGKDGHVSLPAGVAAELADFSITAWVYLNTSPTWSRIFDFGDDRGRYLFLTPNRGDGKVRFATSTVYGYNQQVIDGNAALPTGEWVHVAVTLSDRVGTLYVNGIAAGASDAMDFPPFQIGNTSRNWIGRSQFPDDPYLNGKVDDFRIYDGVLTAEEVAALANTPGNP